MTRRLPPARPDIRILIICEGYEEYDYMARLHKINVWSHDFGVEIKNAKSIDNIAPMYQYNYSIGSYKLVVIFCDTEKAPYDKFLAMKKRIQDFHNKKSAEDVIFFANPCTMQIILSHFAKVHLMTNEKTKNAPLIDELTGVSEYRATEKQRLSIMNKITAENYSLMKMNIQQLSSNYENIPSSNAIQLFSALDKGNKEFIKMINKKIEKN